MEKKLSYSRKRKRITVQAAFILAILFFMVGLLVGSVVMDKTQLYALGNKLERAQTTIDNKNTEIETLKNHLSAKETEGGELEKQLNALQQENSNLLSAVNEKDAEIANLNALLEEAVADKEAPVESPLSSSLKLIILACLAAIFIISITFIIGVFANKKDDAKNIDDSASDDSPLETNDNTQDDDQQKIQFNDTDDYTNSKKRFSKEDDAKISRAIALISDERSEEELEDLGGFYFGVTNLLEIMQNSEVAAEFGREENGDFVAFSIKHGSMLKVLPRSLDIEEESITHRKMADLFNIKDVEGKLPGGDLKINLILSPATFIITEKGWTLHEAGELLAYSISKKENLPSDDDALDEKSSAEDLQTD